ncbi:hypothetical protein HanXRQr2_Chr10g0426281 [Helianthus annuus]|uniref:Uncharacterized protein n=1 Tax=Helianthus annuus TaxID=4232 RepID=A0A9K3N3F5_HELAN|nr:hypothetical protein HanXRQr2_Chr10g0426281 [Helianthus annuus]KAJ0513612.1 hypothetical protein HanHA300_Chr10g0359671 [Helianthus annuus]KAJ0528946.1 hypothetical protein HanHA89_Chr10g0372161 [Helianthus annuus]KAJ0695862.1 hypothetical protein HanLR1_Chr10g0350381 [Helianthus annuus]
MFVRFALEPLWQVYEAALDTNGDKTILEKLIKSFNLSVPPCFRCCLLILVVISALCVSGPTLYWKLKRGFDLKPISLISCTPCICDCPPALSLLKLAPVNNQ